MPNTDIKMLRDELAKVIGTARRHERTIRQQGDQLVRLALERDRAVLEMGTVRAQSKDLRARLAEYGQAIKAYDNQHTPPSGKTITQEINAQKKEERKKKNPDGRRGRHKGHKGVSASRKADQAMRRTPDRCG